MPDPCGDLVPEIRRVRLDARHNTRQARRELSAWLVHHCGRPDRHRGFWWTEEAGQVVCFALPEHFMEFSLRWM
jgi:hypothetical protein